MKKRTPPLRLKAFTLIELLVVMALASIVISLGWYIYANFHRFSLDHYSRSRRVQEWLALDQYMQRDLRNCTGARTEENRLILKNREGHDSIQWRAADKKVMRDAGDFRQTFNAEMTNLKVDTTGTVPRVIFYLSDSTREIQFTHLLTNPVGARR